MRKVLLPLVSLLIAPAIGHAAESVDVALVLVDDVSGSIDDGEFALQKQGYTAAFNDPRVVAAISGGPNGAIAVSYVEFASEFQVSTVINWTVIHDTASAHAFADALAAAPRSARGHTAIGAGVDLGVKMIQDGNFGSARKVIDVCGDGTNNSGPDPTQSRDDALHQGITINGLAIANESNVPWLQAHTHPPGGLDNYYEHNVVGGETSFVLTIHDYGSFAEAITRKLVNEIASR
jgi:Protein of unknown function (DUF1194)